MDLCLRSPTRWSSEGRGQPPKPPQCTPSKHGGNQCQDKPSSEEKREVKMCLEVWSLKAGKYFQNPREVALQT